MYLTGTLLFGWLALWSGQAPPLSQSALETDPGGWVDLLTDKELKDWTRVPLGAVGQLRAGDTSGPSPWKVDPAGGTLSCDGDTVGHELLRYRPELGDFVLHVEWRVTKVEGDQPYNGGVFVRTSADGAVWHQAQTGPAGGYLFANILVNGKPQRVNLREKMTENRVKPAGEWNTYEVRAVGKRITLWVNGAVVNDYTECEVPRGYIGLEAEGYRIEFRSLKVKPLD